VPNQPAPKAPEPTGPSYRLDRDVRRAMSRDVRRLNNVERSPWRLGSRIRSVRARLVREVSEEAVVASAHPSLLW
jgi:hypothetical protein